MFIIFLKKMKSSQKVDFTSNDIIDNEGRPKDIIKLLSKGGRVDMRG